MTKIGIKSKKKSRKLDVSSSNKTDLKKSLGNYLIVFQMIQTIINKKKYGNNACFFAKTSNIDMFLNTWNYYSLYYIKKDNYIKYPAAVKFSPEQFSIMLNACKKRFVFIPLIFIYNSRESHFNMIVYDTKDKEFERFEPYGGFTKNNTVSLKADRDFDTQFKKNIKLYMKNTRYFKPLEFCPNVSFQTLNEDYGTRNKIDPEGFCISWSLWYMEMRLKYPNKSRKEIIDISLESISKNKKGYRSFIRNYTLQLIKLNAQ